MRSLAVLTVGVLLGVATMLFVPHGTPQVVYAGGTPSGNGDVNGDGRVDIADGIYIINYQLRGGPAPIPIECPACPPSGLPATGQTTCYDTAGTEIDCASANWPGQDRFYQKGCPMAERFVDNGDGTVTDNCTSLVWQKEPAPGGQSYNWEQALQYCEDLDFAGHDDWRLPNVREFLSILDYTRIDPCIDPAFGANHGWCWSSTTSAYIPGSAWQVSFNAGYAYDGAKSNVIYVRAVRG